MNKIAYLAAFAAVPAMVAPAQAAVTADQKASVVSLACVYLFVHTMVSDDSISEKADSVNEIAGILESVNRYGAADESFSIALDILSDVSSEDVENLGNYMIAIVQTCEENNYYGSAKLRRAVNRFVNAYLAE